MLLQYSERKVKFIAVTILCTTFAALKINGDWRLSSTHKKNTTHNLNDEARRKATINDKKDTWRWEKRRDRRNKTRRRPRSPTRPHSTRLARRQRRKSFSEQRAISVGVKPLDALFMRYAICVMYVLHAADNTERSRQLVSLLRLHKRPFLQHNNISCRAVLKMYGWLEYVPPDCG